MRAMVCCLLMSPFLVLARQPPKACWKKVVTRTRLGSITSRAPTEHTFSDLDTSSHSTSRSLRSTAGRHRDQTPAARSAEALLEDVERDMSWVSVDTETHEVIITDAVLAPCNETRDKGVSIANSTHALEEHEYLSPDVLKRKVRSLVEHAEDEAAEASSSSSSGRQKRGICDKDDRLPANDTSKYPYGAVVKVKLTFNNCTGTLISPKHVLTGGHCIFNGTRGHFNVGYNSIKILLMRQGQCKEYTVKKFFLPTRWTHPSYSGPYPDRRYDFAVLELKKCLRSPYIKVSSVPHSWITHDNPRNLDSCDMKYHIGGKSPEKTHLMAYAADKPDMSLWYSSCDMTGVRNGIFLQHCDARMGSSGAALYTLTMVEGAGDVSNRPERRIRGVFVGRSLQRINLALAITEEKEKMICDWTNTCGLRSWEERMDDKIPFRRLKDTEYRVIGCRTKQRRNNQRRTAN